MYDRLTDLPGHAAALGTPGLAYRDLGRLADALVVLREGVELFAQAGERFCEAWEWRDIADTHRRLGEPEASRAALRHAPAIYGELRHPAADEVRRELGEPG